LNWVHDTLAEFGRELGLTDFGLGAHGVAQLQMQSGALLAVEPVRRGKVDSVDEVLIYLGQPLGFEATTLRRRALEKVHFSHGGPFAIQIATRGEGPQAMLLMLVRLPERAFTRQTLGHVVEYLDRWFAELRDGR
jgi:type III secretion system chaperone SycN